MLHNLFMNSFFASTGDVNPWLVLGLGVVISAIVATIVTRW